MEDFRATVEYLASLARMDLDEGEKKQLTGQLSAILDAAGRVRELDTGLVEPTSHVICFGAALREDLSRPSLPLEEALKNAPCREKGFFRVPRIGEVSAKELPEKGEGEKPGSP